MTERSNPKTGGNVEQFEYTIVADGSTGGNIPEVSQRSVLISMPGNGKEQLAEQLAARILNAPVKRIKRTEAQMVASLKGDLLSEASYLKNRVSKLEEKIAKLFAEVSPEAAALVLRSESMSHLSRYLP
jgi:hypothetical protein